MWAVSEALEKATETIYIADWWLSPELFLRRPPVEHQEWRLDQVLKRRAEAGVKIYVIVYKEVRNYPAVVRERTRLIHLYYRSTKPSLVILHTLNMPCATFAPKELLATAIFELCATPTTMSLRTQLI